MSDTDMEGSTDSLNHPIYNTLSNFFIGNQLEYFDKHGYPPRFSHYNLSSKTDTNGYEHQSKVSLTPYNWQWNEILICTSLYQSIEVYATPSQSSKLPIMLQSTRHSHNAQRSSGDKKSYSRWSQLHLRHSSTQPIHMSNSSSRRKTKHAGCKTCRRTMDSEDREAAIDEVVACMFCSQRDEHVEHQISLVQSTLADIRQDIQNLCKDIQNLCKAIGSASTWCRR